MSYVTKNFDSEVVRLLKNGGVGFMPADTIYGLSCRALDEQAVHKLHEIKKRDNRPFIILISDTEMLNKLSISQQEVVAAKKYWPGALTLVCRAADSPAWLNLNTQTLAVRIPNRNDLLQLIEAVGPIVSTSANLSGEPAIEDMASAQKTFGNQLDFYVDAGQIHSQPSTVARLKNGQFEILRQGAVKIEQKEA